ncbi:MAG: hypothetical protein FWG19_02035 [Methanomassiliicoccaceae archaeon]|nr:hypothetical protein [Methanomassiliicoccaceae archaeon]
MYRIPNDDRLEDAIRAVMKRNRQILSQNAMKELVLKELRKEDEDYRVSGERIRKVAVDRDILRIEIEYNLYDEMSAPNVCPVCGFPMEVINNSTLDGRDTDIGRKCTKCTYQIGLRKKTPGRYTFNKGRPSKPSVSIDDRVALMNDAAELLRKAASMIERATKGTEHRKRGKKCSSEIIKKITSKKDGNSLANLSKDIENSDPGWTEPLVSVKNANRKNI